MNNILNLCFTLILYLKLTLASIQMIAEDRCIAGLAINDCNWCKCEGRGSFQCASKNCLRVDMFGHFNDAIQDISVGMEGHGVWRTSQTACQPGVHYKRLDLLCVCGSDGNWPNPVCRDVFRVLHPVEISEAKQLENQESCIPTNIYAIDCNVCVCPSFGRFSYEFCTNKTCENSKEPVVEMENHNQGSFAEVYAECSPTVQYKIDSQQCTCISNNRLICELPSSVTKPSIPENKAQVCSNKAPNEIFAQDCNLCFCAENKLICTINLCLRTIKSISKSLRGEIGNLRKKYPKSNKKSNLEECLPGTKYNIDCNKCLCYYNEKGVKTFTCSKNTCRPTNPLELIQANCAVGTVYKKDCQTCSCVTIDGVTWERCIEDISCFPTVEIHKEVNALTGQCDPLETYTKDCNECQCINRKIVSCADHSCRGREDELVEILPIVANYKEDCPTGHSYKLGCNYCYCLSDGNAVCTNVECDVNLVSA